MKVTIVCMSAQPANHMNSAIGRDINALNWLEESVTHCAHRQREKWRALVIPDQSLNLIKVRRTERAMNLNGWVQQSKRNRSRNKYYCQTAFHNESIFAHGRQSDLTAQAQRVVLGGDFMCQPFI